MTSHDMTRDSGGYGAGSLVGIIADGDTAKARCEMAVDAIGGRVAFVASSTDLPKEGDPPIPPKYIVAELSENGDASSAAFDVISESANNGRTRCVVSVSLDCLDETDARFGDSDVSLLCSPSALELSAEMGLASVDRALVLHDSAKQGNDPHLLRLSEEVGRIARALADLSNAEGGNGANSSSLLSAPAHNYGAEPRRLPEMSASDIRSMIRLRRLRDRFFQSELFSDPAWDMLLDLMAARIEGRQVSVSSLCIAAAVPPTTALRWIKTMTQHGIFVRVSDPDDGRRVFIALADSAADAMHAWFAAAKSGDDIIPV